MYGGREKAGYVVAVEDGWVRVTIGTKVQSFPIAQVRPKTR